MPLKSYVKTSCYLSEYHFRVVRLNRMDGYNAAKNISIALDIFFRKPNLRTHSSPPFGHSAISELDYTPG
jgi:hypothetical protein